MNKNLFKITLLAAGLFWLGGCATGPVPLRPDLSNKEDVAYRLKLYYEYRLNGSDKGYWVKWSKTEGYLSDRQLPVFFEKNRDSMAADWARGGNRMTWAGWIVGLALQGAAVGASITTEQPELKWFWAYALLPSAGLVWSFDFLADNWFRKPAVVHYNRELKRELRVNHPDD